MSFVTAQPEALAFAATQLQSLGSAMAAENAAAASPTSAVAPAAADQVSALQAAAFSAYGALYQSIATQAQAVHEQFVATLRASSNSYAAAEGINQASATVNAASAGGLIDWLSTVLGGPLPSINNQPLSLSSNAVNLFHTGMTNWVAATSDLLGMTGGGLIPEAAGAAGSAAAAGSLAAEVTPTAVVAAGLPGAAASAPVSAGMGQAVPMGKLSAPPIWGTEAAAAAKPVTGTPTAAAPAASHTVVPAGMPAVATAGRSGGLGGPRYGVKPTVMGKPPAV